MLASTTDANNITTEYTYDANNNLASLEDGNGNIRSWIYDARNLATEKTYPGNADQLYYEHDALGRITIKTDQQGDTTENIFDLAGRMTSKVYKTGGNTVESTDTFTYDTASRITGTVKGRHNITTAHTFALDGLPLTETLTADGRTYTSTRNYDAGNRPLSHTFPSGEATHWAYDVRNLVSTVHYEDKIIVTNTHDAGYRLAGELYGNGLNRSINYDRQDNLRSSDILKDGNQTLNDLTMVYNYAADKQILSEQISGNLLPSSGFTSAYDAGNRLTNWTRPTTIVHAQTWNFDDSGNWQSTTKTIGNNTATENRNHNTADQITQIAGNAASHDLKGNLTAYEINSKQYEVEYDLENRITKVEVDNDDVEYRYDAFGRRVIRKEGSTTTALIWWGNSECAEHKHQAGQTVIQNDIMSHPSRLNAVIARAVDGSKFKLQWYHKNYLDHVYGVSDDSDDILEHYRYTAFGEVTIYDQNGATVNHTQIDNHILWNTRRRDEVSGYYMYKFRHYAPELGRWVGRDPIEERGGVNLYAFVGNDGINRWDKLGLCKFTINFKLDKQAIDLDKSERAKGVVTKAIKGHIDFLKKMAEICVKSKNCCCDSIEIDYKIIDGTSDFVADFSKDSKGKQKEFMEKIKTFPKGADLNVLFVQQDILDKRAGGSLGSISGVSIQKEDGKGGHVAKTGGILLRGGISSVLSHELGHYLGWQAKKNPQVYNGHIDHDHSSIVNNIMSYEDTGIENILPDAQYCELLCNASKK